MTKITLQVQVEFDAEAWDRAHTGRVALTPEAAVGYVRTMFEMERQGGVIVRHNLMATRTPQGDVIPVGRDRELALMSPVRSVEQRARVLDIVRGNAFAWALYNPFTPDVDHRGPFSFLWVSVTGRVVNTRIDDSGRILSQRTDNVNDKPRARR